MTNLSNIVSPDVTPILGEVRICSLSIDSTGSNQSCLRAVNEIPSCSRLIPSASQRQPGPVVSRFGSSIFRRDSIVRIPCSGCKARIKTAVGSSSIPVTILKQCREWIG